MLEVLWVLIVLGEMRLSLRIFSGFLMAISINSIRIYFALALLIRFLFDKRMRAKSGIFAALRQLGEVILSCVLGET